MFTLLKDNPMLPFFTVIGLGYLVGNIRVAGIEAGPVIGVLLVGLLFGHPGFEAPGGASAFGFALFIFSVGIQAGPTFFSAFAADGVRYVTLAFIVAGTAVALASAGPLIVLSGILVTLVPALVAYAVGRRVLGMNPALLLGSITGAMTSTPALNVVTDAARSSVPALGYAGTYNFANVLLTFAGVLMMVL